MKSRVRKIGAKFATFLIVCCACLFIAGIQTMSVSAASLQPQASDNLQIGLRETSGITATDSGYMRVYYDGQKIGVEYYNDAFQIISKKSIAMELPIWGGFYAGANAYYVVQGQNNTAESNTSEVIRVIKYDKNWNRLGAASITPNADLFGGDVRYPFDYGCVEMTEHNGTLYIVTGHEGYVDASVGQGHQGFLMIAVDQVSMTGKIVDADLWHSFAQYIDKKGNDLYVLEQSEGSRYTKLTKYNSAALDEQESFPVLEYGGTKDSVWAISCYASVDDMAVSSGHVLSLGTSIDQSKYDAVTSNTPHNLYLAVTPIANFTQEATTVRWLTSYSGGGAAFLGTKITKINDNRFMVSWEVDGESGAASTSDTLSGNILHYLFVDGSGKTISREYTAPAPISDCHPIVKNGKVVYYASSSNMVNFYTIDGSSGAFSKKSYRIAGENATWSLKKGVLTISGTGDVKVDTEANYRRPVSSTSRSFIYSDSDNSWMPIRSKVKKIVIESGITSISESAFAGFDNLTEVFIEDGLKTIGAKAFYSCDRLKKITIPASVTKIGEDFLWTGYSWLGSDKHVVYATIYAPKNSYAARYAKKHGIDWVAIYAKAPGSMTVKLTGYDDVKVSWKKASGATGYYVSYKTATSDKWKSLGKTKKTTLQKKNLPDGAKITFKVVAYKKVNGEIQKSAKSKTKSIYTLKKLGKPEVNMISSKNAKLVWENIDGETGYEVARSAKKSKGFKVVKTVKSKKSESSKIKVSKKKYYYKVRAYKTVGGKKIYAPWSKAAACKR